MLFVNYSEDNVFKFQGILPNKNLIRRQIHYKILPFIPETSYESVDDIGFWQLK